MTQGLTIGLVQGAAAGAMWGLVFLAPQVLHDFNALQLSAARYLAYGAIAGVLLAPRARSFARAMKRDDVLAVLQLALLGNVVYYLGLATAVQWAGGAAAALVIGLVPLALTVAGARDPDAVPLRRLWGPLALGAVGTALVAAESLRAGPPDTTPLQRAAGLAGAFIALACWTMYSVINKRWLGRRPDVSAHDGALLVGAATGILAVGLAAAAVALDTLPRKSGDVLRLAAGGTVLALCASVIGNACWNRATRLLPLTLTGQLIIFETLFGLLYGYCWTRRAPTGTEVLATGLLLAGVAWAAAVHRAGVVPVGAPLDRAAKAPGKKLWVCPERPSKRKPWHS
jgi:drug/metabolite transporter (DMT)-like permease